MTIPTRFMYKIYIIQVGIIILPISNTFYVKFKPLLAFLFFLITLFKHKSRSKNQTCSNCVIPRTICSAGFRKSRYLNRDSRSTIIYTNILKFSIRLFLLYKSAKWSTIITNYCNFIRAVWIVWIRGIVNWI